MTSADGQGSADFSAAQRDVAELRDSLQQSVSVETQATSVDGRTFQFQAALTDAIPLGGFVILEVDENRRYLGQVTDRRAHERSGARITVDVPEVAMGSARVSSAEIQLQRRMLVGGGDLLGRIGPADLEPTHIADVFDGAAISVADASTVARFIAGGSKQGATLDIGWSPFAGPAVRTSLEAKGFNRHTFLCGQSGSGKTFSLGVVLERLLTETTLRMIVVDPNSDYVGLGGLRPKESFDRTRAEPMPDEGFAEVAARYEAAAAGLRVLRPGDEGNPLRIRFSELTPHEQATVLRLDPLRDPIEFSAFRRIADRLAAAPYSLADVRVETRRTLQEDVRQIGLRVENLAVADWELWAGETDSPLGDHLADDWRALILDIGGLGSADQQSVVAMSLLGRLWRRREEREPVLVVIDEAHNVCPAEPEGALQALATEHVVRIAGEGRKFGIYLLLSTQRPQKLHPNVLSQCDNLVLMRMNSLADIEHLAATFSFVPPRLLEESTGFGLGNALVAGKISPVPMLTKIEGRLSPEGGGDVASAWAARQ